MLTSLINEIDAGGTGFVVIIDDWHRITDVATIEALAYLLDHGGHLLQVVVTSRARAGLPMGRMRVRDELVEIDGAAVQVPRRPPPNPEPWHTRQRDSLGRLIRGTEAPTDTLPVLVNPESTQLSEYYDARVGQVLELAVSIGSDNPIGSSPQRRSRCSSGSRTHCRPAAGSAQVRRTAARLAKRRLKSLAPDTRARPRP